MKILTGLILATTACAEIIDLDDFRPKQEISFKQEDSYRYVGFGIGPLFLPFPNVNFGLRKQSGNHGFDCGLGIASVGVITHVKGYANYLFYPNPSPDAQTYFGIGAAGGPWFYEGTMFTAAGNFVIGRSFQKNRQFLQADISYPAYLSSYNGVGWTFPFVTFSYGFGF